MNEKRQQLFRLAARQSSVVTTSDLYELGFSKREVLVLVTQGVLHRIHEGVYAVGHRNLTVKGHLTAARMAAGPHAFFSDHTAAAIRNLTKIDTSRIELTIPVGHTPPQRTGLILHRTTTEIDSLEVGWHNGLRVSTVPRLLVEISSRRCHDTVLEALLAEAVRTNVFNPELLERMIQRHPRQPGVANLKRVADYYRPLGDRKSELERMFQREHARRREIPPCERNVLVGDERVGIWEVDCLWREQGVALELDGRRFHAAQLDYDKDRRKDTALQLMRISPMRASYWMFVKDQETVFADLLGLLALGADRIGQAA